ncbi:hypothetical protein DL546_004140 [Coniochaeta pulveracea]|uniref:Uncharacterized protein n=1 Tax=Coniochaeta pulveracea TaxID=177199 RepID=A0A420Y9Y5_9PEZI|nr:hypothetical protein DL546_004140 [Coniochaeta pulveracea]
MAATTSKPGPTLQYDSHQQSVPIPEHFDAPPSYAEAQQSTTSASATSPPSDSHPHSQNHIASSPRSSASSNIPGEGVPLQHRNVQPKMTTGYQSPPPMTAAQPSDEDEPDCCCSSSGGCCFSTNGGCCFSTNGGCCFSKNGGCCFSRNGGCCFGKNGGCCNATREAKEERLRYY